MGNSPVVARINSLLAEKGIAKQDFYRDCKITSASYSLWNTGKTVPRIKNLETIAQYLHTTTDYLLTGLGEKEKTPTSKDERTIDDPDDFIYAMSQESPYLSQKSKDQLQAMAKFLREQDKAEKET